MKWPPYMIRTVHILFFPSEHIAASGQPEGKGQESNKMGMRRTVAGYFSSGCFFVQFGNRAVKVQTEKETT